MTIAAICPRSIEIGSARRDSASTCPFSYAWTCTLTYFPLENTPIEREVTRNYWPPSRGNGGCGIPAPVSLDTASYKAVLATCLRGLLGPRGQTPSISGRVADDGKA